MVSTLLLLRSRKTLSYLESPRDPCSLCRNDCTVVVDGLLDLRSNAGLSRRREHFEARTRLTVIDGKTRTVTKRSWRMKLGAPPLRSACMVHTLSLLRESGIINLLPS